MHYIYTCVKHFNEGVLNLEFPPLGPMNKDVGDHLVKCLIEEAHELLEAHDQQDLVKCVDALIDSIYFAVGGLQKLGLTQDEAIRVFELVHNANMTKKRGQKEGRIVGDAADAIKTAEWIPPENAIHNFLFCKGEDNE